ncbi:hypothetical protein [Streptomyces clavuligerus]|uniref:hypothetical protein n=1 Tax=Streptomyces clavuligerus TaxID=1901 RepID=UPI00237964B7|nr:hypothetical protein [Streptomyces clavuligerus]WDN57114.1 hypothetical protein LL058_35595 [Streptomyces clavuligerus]
MKNSVARWRWGRAGRLLLVGTLVGLVTACSSDPSPSREELRQQATSSAAESRRDAEERKARGLVERLTAVEGVEHVLTRLTDTCGMPSDGSLFDPQRPSDALHCEIRTFTYVGVRGDVTAVLPRIKAAGIADWGVRDGSGGDMPHAAGTVTYALDYHRGRGRDRDGGLLPAPTLTAPGLRLDWDRPDLPLRYLAEEPTPCPAKGAHPYQRCETTPPSPGTVAAARARYGTVMVLELGGSGSTAYGYYTVPRGG